MSPDTTTAPAIATTYTVTPAKAHDWAVCGGFFAARHCSGSRSPRSYACLLGTAAHELVVAYDRFARPDPCDTATLIEQHWRPGRFGPDDDARARGEARALLATYVAATVGEIVTIVDHECFVQTTRRSLGEGRCIVLSGRMDRVARLPDEAIEVLDVKTGGSLPTPDELRRDPGTTIYHLLAQDRYATQTISIVQLSLRTGARVEVRLSPGDVSEGKDKLREMVRQLATNGLTLSPNGACAYCPARPDCPALRSHDERELASF